MGLQPEGAPVRRIRCCEGLRPTNVAFGGPDRKTRYIAEADSGAAQCAKLEVSGVLMYSHLG